METEENTTTILFSNAKRTFWSFETGLKSLLYILYQEPTYVEDIGSILLELDEPPLKWEDIMDLREDSFLKIKPRLTDDVTEKRDVSGNESWDELVLLMTWNRVNDKATWIKCYLHKMSEVWNSFLFAICINPIPIPHPSANEGRERGLKGNSKSRSDPWSDHDSIYGPSAHKWSVRGIVTSSVIEVATSFNVG